MKEFVECLQNDHAVTIQMEVDNRMLSVEAGMKIKHELFLVFKEALTQIAASGTASLDVQADHTGTSIILQMHI